MKIRISDYINHHKKIKTKKISGYLKSSLRKRDSDIAYNNIISSEYMFFEYLNLKQKEEIKYKPKILIIQICINLLLLGIIYYLFIINLIYIMTLTTGVLFLNWFIIWVYSFISIIRSRFKKRWNKQLWFLLIVFLPFSAFFYPDFRKIQVEI